MRDKFLELKMYLWLKFDSVTRIRTLHFSSFERFMMVGAVIGLILGIIVVIVSPSLVIQKFELMNKTGFVPILPQSNLAFSLLYFSFLLALIGMVSGFLLYKKSY